ncbi:Uncharacterised protein [Vibrio cholerae]|nr:Uncharacterised protein [Vibrio cholerae]
MLAAEPLLDDEFVVRGSGQSVANRRSSILAALTTNSPPAGISTVLST